jgi:predicted ArsR family transcriptional regulator
MDSGEITLKDIADRLDELVAWQRFESLPKLREVLLKELDSDVKKLAYEMTDGEKSRRDIASTLGISDDNVQKWWQRWYELAIVRPSKSFKGRPQHIVSLEDVGIKLPKAVSVKKEAETELAEESIGKISEGKT